MRVKFERVKWKYTSVFRIAYKTITHAETVLVELDDNGLIGRGEALGVFYHGETVDTIIEQLSSVSQNISDSTSHADLEILLPPGGARNALDCALWDLRAKRTGRRAWELAGLPSVHPITTDYTLGLDTPEAMGRAAAAALQYTVFKIKLDGSDDLDRVAAVRTARPDAKLTVDVNQAWTEQQLRELTPQLVPLGVTLIEQPLPAGRDEALSEFNSPIPLCADESCQTSLSLPAIIGKYQYINIKLDKTGGLSEALRLARLARDSGLKLMVGCMGGSSLSMAPGFIIGQWCDFVDLDSPLLITSDVPNALRYDGGKMNIPDRHLWG